MKKFETLEKAKILARDLYKIAKALPQEENYVLKSQIMRCAVSIVSNLAEGRQRTEKEFVRFIRDTRGSISEVIVQLELVKDFYPEIQNIPESLDKCEELLRMTYGLIGAINNEE